MMNNIPEEPTEYPRLKNLLMNLDEDYSLTEEYTLDRIYSAVLRDITHSQHVGINARRLEHNPREKAFFDQWMIENDPRRGTNHGNGILQDLFIESDGVFNKKMVIEIEKRDRIIVATIIQWLGSNCGMGFLHEALGKCGYVITSKK